METCFQSSQGQPVETIKVGSVSIFIFAAPVTIKVKAKSSQNDSNGATSLPQYKTYPSFQFAYYEGARRILKRRNKLEVAKKLAKEIAGRLNRDGARAAYFTEKDRRILTLAENITKPQGLEVDEVCRRYAELQRRLKSGSVEEAVDFFNAHGQRVRHGSAVKTVYEEYEQHLLKRGAGDYYLRDVKRYLGGFIEAFPGKIDPIQTSEIDAYLAKLGGKARTKNNNRDAVIALFNFAQEKGFLPHGVHAAAATTEFRESRKTINTEQEAIDLMEPEDIYSPAEMRKILAVEDELIIRPTLEIKAFSGVRTEEITRLWWVMVAEAEGCLKVPDAVGKICARRVPLLPNLQARLAAYPAETKQGRVAADWQTANAVYHAWQRVIEKAGVPYRRNGFRNSYITYRLILTENIIKVAEETGTSPEMIKQNYQSRAAISRQTAEEWFTI